MIRHTYYTHLTLVLASRVTAAGARVTQPIGPPGTIRIAPRQVVTGTTATAERQTGAAVADVATAAVTVARAVGVVATYATWKWL